MQAYQIVPGSGTAGLFRTDKERRSLRPDEVRVRIHAVALNYRDLMVAQGNYIASSTQALIPCSDAAGDIIETGTHANRFRPGERVVTSFFTDWLDGRASPEKTREALGGSVDGVLAEEVVLKESALVRMPPNLDFAEAATLSCAGVTAWNALFVEGRLKAGDSVLLQGTGGVSIWGLQLAKAAGVHAIITSSNDQKLERARELGAAATINYLQKPEWHEEVLKLTDGRGADLVLDVGGNGTLSRSIAAAGAGGTIAVIGGISGGFSSQLQLLDLIAGAKRLAGIFVGNRTMLEELARCVEHSRLRPVVDRVFAFNEAIAAYEHLRQARHFGKIVIRVQA